MRGIKKAERKVGKAEEKPGVSDTMERHRRNFDEHLHSLRRGRVAQPQRDCWHFVLRESCVSCRKGYGEARERCGQSQLRIA